MSDAREAILGKIQSALADVPTREAPLDVLVDRSYLTTDLEPDGRVDRFIERVSEYQAKVHRVEADALPSMIASLCASREIRCLVLPPDIPEEWIPAELTALRDDSLTNAQLNESDGVLTGCALGIAQTGTIVLDRGNHQGRRALTLLPDYHLCVIREDQIVGIVPEAVSTLSGSADLPNRPMTWISGPRRHPTSN